ncbi:MAG: DNA mismatch repair endonuclease MutL [Oscillospiraceae bacterium]
MPKIIQLDRHVADLIAAGEVVERPASAVKELVENSIDAGAKNITIELQNGGMTFLRITDDGCGMEPVDARTAFLRHATSKIRKKEDLACIGTLGFRGEALAAISSVSKIDLLTRAQGAENGVRLHLEAGQVLSEEPAGCPCGTTILVRELFYNTPARMKFMKSDAAESSAVFSVVQQQALAHPEISFRFLKDGQEQLHTDGQGDRMAAIYAIYGRELANNMLPVDGSWEKLRVRGFVTKPTATRGNRAWQSFFVNNRYIKSRLLSAALEEAYRNQIMVGRFPACVLEIDMPVQAVDVNVHPAKTEVKFLSEREVFDARALCRFVHALQSGGPPGMENAGEKAGGRTAAAITAKGCPAAKARLLSDHAGIRIPPSGCAAACAEAGPARAGLAGAAAALRACACAAELSASEAGSKAGGQTGAEARTED